MSYALEISVECNEEVKKYCKKNWVLESIVKKKITEILENPHHYKPLRHDLAGKRRVHILKSFVLIFEINEEQKTVRMLNFEHHDEAYRR